MRGLLMGRIAQACRWRRGAPHCRLFEECGKAVLYANSPETYLPLLKSAPNDGALVDMEQNAFGVTHPRSARACAKAGGCPPPR
jgi:hypothetical protein